MQIDLYSATKEKGIYFAGAGISPGAFPLRIHIYYAFYSLWPPGGDGLFLPS